MNDFEEGYECGLKDSSCRFNCRNERESFLAGFNFAVQKWIDTGRLGGFPEEAYREWKRDK
jgi:hypothetical protein